MSHTSVMDKAFLAILQEWRAFDNFHNAIAREKQVKNWRREKKLWLIARMNPGWKDLTADW